jgi:hypothetical protein
MHRLGAVPVGIEQEPSVVVRPVLGPQARLPVVGVPGVDPRAPERVHVLARRRGERHVKPPGGGIAVAGIGHREVLPFGEPLRAVRPVDPQCSQHGVVEALRRRAVADADGHVVEHGQ